MMGEGMGMDEAMERGGAMRVPEDLRRAHVRDAEGPGPLARLWAWLWDADGQTGGPAGEVDEPAWVQAQAREEAAAPERPVGLWARLWEMDGQLRRSLGLGARGGAEEDDEEDEYWNDYWEDYHTDIVSNPAYSFLLSNIHHDDDRD